MNNWMNTVDADALYAGFMSDSQAIEHSKDPEYYVGLQAMLTPTEDDFIAIVSQ